MVRDYIATKSCRMEFLRRCLDDPGAAPCGRCDNCAGPSLSSDVSAAAVEAARAHLDRVGVEISPRAQWPTGLPAIGIKLSGRIAVEERPQPGHSLARLSDLGWGEQLRELLDDESPDGPAPENVLRGIDRVLAGWATMGPRPVGVVTIESRRRPLLIASIATRIAAVRGIPLLGVLSAAPRGQSASRANSARRVSVLQLAVSVPPALARACAEIGGPVMLVDDLVDSGWTMTLAARALRKASAVEVLPFALAMTGRRD